MQGIVVRASWSNIGEGITHPTYYHLRMVPVSGGDNILLSNIDQDDPNITNIPKGSFKGSLYNTAADITVTNTVANMSGSGGIINAMPGWFFTGVQNFTITDYLTSVTFQMQQQTRELNFDISILDDITIGSATIKLEGVAGTMDIMTGELSDASSISVDAAVSGTTLTAKTRLLGIVSGSTQTMTVTVNQAGGGVFPIVVNVSSDLAGFNENKKTPFTLSKELSIP